MSGESFVSLFASFAIVAITAVILRPRESGPPPAPPPKVVAESPPTAEAVPATRPPSPFTRVEPGESLEAVARRVYGSAAEAQRLWTANRDLLSSLEATPPEGSLLRTPPTDGRGP